MFYSSSDYLPSLLKSTIEHDNVIFNDMNKKNDIKKLLRSIHNFRTNIYNTFKMCPGEWSLQATGVNLCYGEEATEPHSVLGSGAAHC